VVVPPNVPVSAETLRLVASELTDTVKEALAVPGVSSPSVAVQVTVVAPMGKVEPEAVVQPTAAAGLSPA
jgi:hypothetical protein